MMNCRLFLYLHCGPRTPGYLMWLEGFPINADDGLSLKLPVNTGYVQVGTSADMCYFFPQLDSLSEQ